jgi:hypothetical protein
LKVLKFLSVPVMGAGVLALMTATVAANHAEISAKLTCSSATKVCFDLTVSTADFSPDTRHFTLTLLGHKKGDASGKFTPIGQSQDLALQNNLNNADVPNICFDNVTTTDFDSFKLDIEAVGDNLTVNGHTEVALGPFDSNCPTPLPSPSPSVPASPSPSPSPSANTTVVLAQTGGFDFRFPLIGLTLLVAGGALYLVSASRGRSAGGR